MVEKNRRKELMKAQRSQVGLAMNLGPRIMEKSEKAKRRQAKIKLAKWEEN